MACVTEYSAEQLNYYRICYITTDVLADGLRTAFKKEWDNRYKINKGRKESSAQKWLDFYNGESPRNQIRNSRLLATMIDGNTAEWDCTMFFLRNPLLLSTVWARLFTQVYMISKISETNSLHTCREVNSQTWNFRVPSAKYKLLFQALGLSTLQIQGLRNQTSFRTDELRNVLCMLIFPEMGVGCEDRYE